MRNLGLYLPILAGLAIFLMLAIFIRHHGRSSRRNPRPIVPAKQAPHEEFYCVKTSLKQVNENFFIAQVVYTNRMSVTFDAHPHVPRQISED
jgi:hypothetical protein